MTSSMVRMSVTTKGGSLLSSVWTQSYMSLVQHADPASASYQRNDEQERLIVGLFCGYGCMSGSLSEDQMSVVRKPSQVIVGGMNHCLDLLWKDDRGVNVDDKPNLC